VTAASSVVVVVVVVVAGVCFESSRTKEEEPMFTELMPLLKQQQVVITVACLDGGLLRVNVIPKKRGQEINDNPALAVPLSFTGSPAELDRELPGQLASFTDSVIKTGSNLDELRAEHAAAIKAVEAENRKKLEDKRKLSGSKGTSGPPQEHVATEPKDGRLALFGAKPSPPQPAAATLFDAQESGPESEPAEAPAAKSES
jgi:PRTRC genetic system protein E